MLEPLQHDALGAATGIAHGFFTRAGGVSSGIYASLNCGMGSHDDRAAVRENRARVTAHLHGRTLLTCHQIHSAKAMVVDQAWAEDEWPTADAMVTRQPGIVLGVLTADCAPVLFADPQAKVIGAAHAGWRGALGGVLEATIAEMEVLGARREQIRAVVGPCIGPSAYEVGWEFKDEFLRRDAVSERFFATGIEGSRPHFDLAGYAADRLERAGVWPGRREACTYAQLNDFFSYRRSVQSKENDYGRQISAIVLT
jgi:hypothetical protein